MADRIQPKKWSAANQPRGLWPQTETVISPTGRMHKACMEEAQILVRSFGFVNITAIQRSITEGVIEDESSD